MAIIGIDLGTTNSLACVCREGTPVLIPNSLGETLTPSVVSVDENGEICVGAVAKERLISHPEASAASFKRYMFQYEPWNITTKQYKQWGEEYERYCEEWADGQGEWHEVYDPDTGEYLCRAYVTTYEYVEDHEEPETPPTRFMTLGSAYYFLQDRQAQITIGDYSDGFLVEFDGSHRYFGLTPEVEFAYLQGCY